jgi:hypothetical protein
MKKGRSFLRPSQTSANFLNLLNFLYFFYFIS